MNSACAMSRLERPSAAIAATRRSLGVSASTPLTTSRRGAGAGCNELLVCPLGEEGCAEPLRVLEPRGCALENDHRLANPLDPLAPLEQPENSERAAERARRAPLARELEVLARELERVVGLSERVMRSGRERAPRRV